MFRLSDEYSFADIYIYTFLFSIALKTFYRVCMYKEKRKHERERERERKGITVFLIRDQFVYFQGI